MKNTTTAAVAHWPTARAATTPRVIRVCEMICRLSAARSTLRKTGNPPISTTARPTGQGTRVGDGLEESQPLAHDHDEQHDPKDDPEQGQDGAGEVLDGAEPGLAGRVRVLARRSHRIAGVLHGFADGRQVHQFVDPAGRRLSPRPGRRLLPRCQAGRQSHVAHATCTRYSPCPGWGFRLSVDRPC